MKKPKPKPKPMKLYSQWVREDMPSDLNTPLFHKHLSRSRVAEDSGDDQVHSSRNAIVALIMSGALDAFIKSDFLMKENFHAQKKKGTTSACRKRCA